MPRELWVGPNETFKTLASAVGASAAGDTIYMRAGTYLNDWATIKHPLTIVGVGGHAHLQNNAFIPNGKAILVTQASVTLENIRFSGAMVHDTNGAGIRYEAGDLTIRNSIFTDNENGILAASNPTGRISITGSEFGRNGLYVAPSSAATICGRMAGRVLSPSNGFGRRARSVDGGRTRPSSAGQAGRYLGADLVVTPHTR